jgi:predicted XRE-type DNA-binding protein
MNMKARKRRSDDEHAVRAVTPPGRSVFHDLFPAGEAAELEIRSTLLHGLEHWLANSGMTQVKAAKTLGVTQARVSDIKRGKISQFSLDLLVRIAARAGLHPKLKLVGESTDQGISPGIKPSARRLGNSEGNSTSRTAQVTVRKGFSR